MQKAEPILFSSVPDPSSAVRVAAFTAAEPMAVRPMVCEQIRRGLKAVPVLRAVSCALYSARSIPICRFNRSFWNAGKLHVKNNRGFLRRKTS
jgi:hypothetical protein